MQPSSKKTLGCWFATLLERKRKQDLSLAGQFGANAQSALDAEAAPRRGSLTRDGLTLADLQPGECGYISRLCGSAQGRLRLLEMGMTPGTHVQVVRAAAFGGPLDVEVRNYQLSLRREEAALVWLGDALTTFDEAEDAEFDFSKVAASEAALIKDVSIEHVKNASVKQDER